MLEQYVDGLGLVSPKNYWRIIKPTFDLAVRRGWVQHNPCDDIYHKRVSKAPVEVFEIEEVKKLISIASPQWRKDVIEIAFRTGMRPGEIFALKWDSINFLKKRIIVKTNCCYAPEQGIVIGSPKTPASIRCIDLDDCSVEILQRIFRTSCSDFVFGKDDGGPRFSSTLGMAKLCDKANIRRRKLKHMRSTHISLLIEEHVDLPEIQSRIGHASPATLLRY